MKHQMSELRDLLVQADIDDARKEVTVRVPHIDSALITTFVMHNLPEHVEAARDDNDKDEWWLTPPAPYALFVECFGALHRAHVVRLHGPKEVCTLALEDPAEERMRRCLETAIEVLRALHGAGVEARVVGSVAREGPWHRNTDVDVLVMNREVPTHGAADPDVRRVVEGQSWRAPLDIFYACWWSEPNATEPFLLWSPAQRRCVPAEWSKSEKRFIVPGEAP